MAAPFDLAQCDREPVHIPGAIQPHGMLFVLDPETLTIRCVSDNAATFLGLEPAGVVGRTIDSVASMVDDADLGAALREDDLEPHNPLALRLRAGITVDAIAHRHDGRLLLECEPEVIEDASYFSHRVRASLVRIRATHDLDGLCTQAAREIRDLTGFDRVIVYRFRPDLSGEVVAEAAAAQSYLGLRFPAADIPSQARALYAACRLRNLPTAAYAPARLVGVPDDRPIDLTHATLRAVSPVHLQYMKNMGVTASMGLSLMEDDRLWGLITCNHESGALFIPYHARMGCALIGEIVSSLIVQRMQLVAAELRAAFLSTQTKLTQFVAQDRDAAHGLFAHMPSLLDVTTATGAALYFKHELQLVGATPPPAEVLALLQWLELQETSSLVEESLPARYSPAHLWKDVGCGLIATKLALASTVPDHAHAWLLWFRPEVVRTVKWGGQPSKAAIDGVLTPRRSFELWKEDVRLTSAPFSEGEVAAALSLTEALSDVLLEIETRAQIERGAIQLEEANRRLVEQIEETRRVELELRHAQKLEAVGRLAAGIAHEINTPLQFVTDGLAFLKEAFADLLSGAADVDLPFLTHEVPGAITRSLDGLARMSTLTRAMMAFAHPDRAEKAAANLDRAISTTLEVARSEVRDIATVTLDLGGLPLVPCFLGDLNQVLLNLIINAAHAIQDTLGGDRTSGTITIRSWVDGDDACISIVDDGAGIPEAIRDQVFLPFFTTKEVGRGTGQGLAIARTIVVDRHGGSLTFVSEVGRGTTFTIRLPLSVTAA